MYEALLEIIINSSLDADGSHNNDSGVDFNEW